MKRSIFLLFAIVSVAVMIAISGCNRPETYTVIFNPNGGTGTMESQTFTEGEALALTRNAFTYEGYTFTGWNTVQGGSGASYTDQQTITATADMTLYAQWTSNGTNPTPAPTPGPQSTTGTLNGHDWVDLGLPSGTKWATCNVGASTPTDYGNYYAWGETTTKSLYTEDNYTYSSNPTTLPSSADAATANWGSGWRMPTVTEMQELIDNCTVTWTTQSGVNGQLFTGPNGNSIFLPAAGYRYYSEFYEASYYGLYWSSSLITDETVFAWDLSFDSGDYGVDGCYRYFGRSVRPVCVSQN
ncbi:MAG: InlB B-repeat-containing protein [Bacteroidales bacterium]|nr:InlB B-repeat-containing protein [Bacteroidales bacterium]